MSAEEQIAFQTVSQAPLKAELITSKQSLKRKVKYLRRNCDMGVDQTADPQLKPNATLRLHVRTSFWPLPSPSVSPSVCPFARPSLRQSLSVRPPVCLSVHSPLLLSFHSTVCPSGRPSVRSPFCLSLRSTVRPSGRLSVRLSVRLCIRLSVCLPVCVRWIVRLYCFCVCSTNNKKHSFILLILVYF